MKVNQTSDVGFIPADEERSSVLSQYPNEGFLSAFPPLHYCGKQRPVSTSVQQIPMHIMAVALFQALGSNREQDRVLAFLEFKLWRRNSYHIRSTGKQSE